VDPYSLVIEKAATLIIDSLIGSAVGGILGELKPEFQILHRRLDSIQESLEQQRSMWLRSALSFLRLGETEKARDELVRATASDDRDALSRLILGLLLAVERKDEFAKEYLLQAWRKNPFLILSLIERGGNSIPKVDWALANGQWSLFPFPTKAMKDSFQINNWFMWLFGGRRKVVALDGVSSGSSLFIVLWRFAHELGGDEGGIPVLSALDLGSGACEWSIEVEHSELAFATPEYVVLMSLRRKGIFNFYLASSGAVCGEMRQAYAETVFCPNREDLLKSKSYARSHHKFLGAKIVLGDFRTGLENYYRLPSRERKVVEAPSGYWSERVTLTSFLDECKWGIEARNGWKYCTRSRKVDKFASETVEYVHCTPSLRRQG
jgi:hypothetical protein